MGFGRLKEAEDGIARICELLKSGSEDDLDVRLFAEFVKLHFKLLPEVGRKLVDVVKQPQDVSAVVVRALCLNIHRSL